MRNAGSKFHVFWRKALRATADGPDNGLITVKSMNHADDPGRKRLPRRLWGAGFGALLGALLGLVFAGSLHRSLVEGVLYGLVAGCVIGFVFGTDGVEVITYWWG